MRSTATCWGRERPQVQWLINAAGFGKMGTNEEIGLEALDKMVLLNCKAAMDMTQRTMPYLVRGSHVLEICSTARIPPAAGAGWGSMPPASPSCSVTAVRFIMRCGGRGSSSPLVCPLIGSRTRSLFRWPGKTKRQRRRAAFSLCFQVPSCDGLGTERRDAVGFSVSTPLGRCAPSTA